MWHKKVQMAQKLYQAAVLGQLLQAPTADIGTIQLAELPLLSAAHLLMRGPHVVLY